MVLLAVAPAATALAHHNGAPTVDHYVKPDGTGQLIANPGGHPLTWDRCSPDGTCERLAETDQFLRTGDPPPGTTFVATQDGTSVRSQPWGGLVRATAPPRLEGEPAVGSLVRPLAATWTGGWGREADWLQLQACRTAEGGDCVVMVDEIKHRPCEPGGGRYLPGWARGRWLLVVDTRIDQSQPFSAEGYFAPEGVRPNVATGSGTAVAAFGPVGEGAARRSGCPWRTRVQLNRVHLPYPIFGQVTCPGRCTVQWRVRQGRRTIHRRVRGAYVTLSLDPPASQRLRSGRAHLRIRVDGRVVRSATVTVRAPRR